MDTKKYSKVERDKVIEELFREMYQPLFRFAKRALDPFLAESAVQDTFLIAVLKFESMMTSGNIRGWLVNVLKGEIQNRRKQKRRQDRYNILVDDPESYKREDDEIAFRELREACIQGVGEEAFEQFADRYIRCIPIKDAAAKYGLPESTYKSRTERTRKKLQKLLKNFF